jgi:hypothetical protein
MHNFSFLLLVASIASAAPIERIWLTHQKPDSVVVNWETDEALDSQVSVGDTVLEHAVITSERVKLHHVEIPYSDSALQYRVRSGNESSATFRLTPLPKEELRVAIVSNIGYKKATWADAVLREKPHLLLTAGDNVPSLHNGEPVAPNNRKAFGALIDQAPELFRTVPFLPALGNHDREIRPRGPKPPAEAVYDVAATAFCEFFALPGDEWHWHFDVPKFGVRFIALDLSHVQDQDTTWQTNHAFARDSDQFVWYRDLIAASKQPFVITLYNERNGKVRSLEGGEWGRMISQGSLAVSGFGYFAERAEVDGFTYYNTSISGTGDRYPDSKSVVLKSEHNFLLLTFRHDPPSLRVELKNLSGTTLDQKEFTPRLLQPK